MKRSYLPLLGVGLAAAAIVVLNTRAHAQAPTVHTNPVIPDDPFVAPAYGNYPSFPDTNYLSGINYGWRKINQLTAVLRENNQQFSVREFIQPAQVADLSFPNDPPEAALSKMFLRVIDVPYVVDPNNGDYWRYPSDTLVSGGDCEDTSFLLTSMAANRGIDVYMAAGFFIADQPYGHAWVIARIPGKGEFIYESTLDFRPSSLWVEVHNSPLAQHYQPVMYWNLQNIFVAGDRYKQILSHPFISKQVNAPQYQPLGADLPLVFQENDQKQRQIFDAWSR